MSTTAGGSTRAPKYRNRKVEYDGRRFDSALEARRYAQLRGYADLGQIRDLVLQVRYPLHCSTGAVVCHYVADFEYVDVAAATVVTEDAKGFETDVYKLKKRWFEAEYGRPIKEIRK